MKKIKIFLAKVYIFLLKILPIKKNRIYFVSNFGKRYSCNPRAYFEYLYKSHKGEFDFYYCLNYKENDLPTGIKSAKYCSIKDLYYLSTSKYIVNNFRFHSLFKKRKKQIYIQTWHGAPVPIKAVEAAVENNLAKEYVRDAQNDAKYIDIVTVGSDSVKNLFEKYFWNNGKILNAGTPRYDSLVNANKEEINQAKERIGINKTKKLFLIAPTFDKNKKLEESLMNIEKIIQYFKEFLNEDVQIAYRFHPNVAHLANDLDLGMAINLTNISNVDDVVLASDYIVTDFSSILVDGMYAHKKCICYVENFDNYIKNNVLWLEPDLFPIKVCKTFNELLEEIKNMKNYSPQKVMEIINNNYGSTEKGKACESLYNEMIKLGNKK